MPMAAAAAFMAATSSRVAKRPCGCEGPALCQLQANVCNERRAVC